MKDDLVERIYEYLRVQNITQETLANRLGTSGVNVHNWLKRKHKINKGWKEVIKKLLKEG